MRSLLDLAERLRMVAAETSLDDGLDATRELRPSILIVDKAFGMYAVESCLEVVRRLGCGTSVIVWGNSLAEAEALHFLHAGAAGVIRKTAPLDALLRCLHAVASGVTWVEDDLLFEREHTAEESHSPLTARELQVMELVERGMKNKDIAAELGIRTGTVKIHLKHIFEKTGIRGRYGLALSGLKQKGLLAMVPAGSDL